MSTFRASVRVEGDTLHVSRPLTAPEKVADMIASLEYAFASGDAAGVDSVDLTIETSAESETPIGDGITATSSTPLAAATVDDEALA
jgi:hypothetical protein